MPEHEYNLSEALKLLISKAMEFDQELGEAVERAVAEGKDVQETEASRSRSRKARKFRKATPYTEEEALAAALAVFRAALVEFPHVANTSLDEFSEAGIDERPAIRERYSYTPALEMGELHQKGQAKEVLIDMTVETQLEAERRDDIPLKRVSEREINDLDETYDRLRRLTTF